MVGKLEASIPLVASRTGSARRCLTPRKPRGKLTKDTLIVEATSGNTGIALAFACAARAIGLW